MSKPKPFESSSLISRKYNRTDPILESWFVKKIIGGMPLKSRSRNRALVYYAFKCIRNKMRIRRPALALGYTFHRLRPLFWIRTRRMGKRVKSIPYRLSPHKGYRFTVRWFIRAFRIRKGSSLQQRLEQELLAFISGKSIVQKWKKNLSRSVRRNSHNATFRW